MRDPQVEEALPVKPVDLLVLMRLATGECHGYGIVMDIAEGTDGRVRLVPGNLYSVLRRLMTAGLIREADRRAVEEGLGKRRRYYSITPLGKRVLGAETQRLRELVLDAEALEILPPLESR